MLRLLGVLMAMLMVSCSSKPQKVLTADIARDWLANPKDGYLAQFTSIEDHAAFILSGGNNLSLDRLTSLTDKQAESLSKHEGMLWLKGLTSLTDKQAESLSKHEGTLKLSGLTSLTEPAKSFLRANSQIEFPFR